MKRNKNYQLGASHERQSIVAYIRRQIAKLPLNVESRYDLGKVLEWIERRTERFNKRPKGLQGRKAKVAK